MRLMLAVLALAFALAGVACQPAAQAEPTPAATASVLSVPSGAQPGPIWNSVDRGGPPPALVGEAQQEEQDLRLRAWVSRAELYEKDEVGVFAQVERAGQPVSNGMVLVMLSGTKSGGGDIIRLRTGPDGLATLKLAAATFRSGVPAQILISALDGGLAVDVELRIFVDSSGGS